MYLWWPASVSAASVTTHWSPADGARGVPPNAVVRQHSLGDDPWTVEVLENGTPVALERVEVAVKVGTWLEWAPIDGFTPGAWVEVWSADVRIASFEIGPLVDDVPPTWDGGWTPTPDGSFRLTGIEDDWFGAEEIALLATPIDGRIDLPYAGRDGALVGPPPAGQTQYQIVLVDGAGNGTLSMPLNLAPPPPPARGCACTPVVFDTPHWGLVLAFGVYRRLRKGPRRRQGPTGLQSGYTTGNTICAG